jgi:hypothetical protein
MIGCGPLDSVWINGRGSTVPDSKQSQDRRVRLDNHNGQL